MLDWLIHTVRVQVPDGWTQKSSGSAQYTADPKTPMSLVVESEKLSAPMEVQAYAARVLFVLKQQFTAYQSVSEKQRTVGGSAAIERIHAFKLQNKQITQVQLYLIHEQRAYTVTVGQLSASKIAPVQAAEDIFSRIKPVARPPSPKKR